SFDAQAARVFTSAARQRAPSPAHLGRKTGRMASNDPALPALYRTMRLIRRSEETAGRLFADGEIPGFIHLSIGQEAVAAGITSALRRDDTLASTHRGHGHTLAKGVALDRFFLELMGKAEGLCGGRGGSMHVADLGVGML